MATALARILTGTITALFVSSAAWSAPPAPAAPPAAPSDDIPVGLWAQYWLRAEQQLDEARRQTLETALADVDSISTPLRIDVWSTSASERFDLRVDDVCPVDTDDDCALQLTIASIRSSEEAYRARIALVGESAIAGWQAGSPVEDWPDLTDDLVREFVDLERVDHTACPGLIRGLEAIEAMPIHVDWIDIGEEDDGPFTQENLWFIVSLSGGGFESPMEFHEANTAQAREIADAFLGELGDCGLRALDNFPVGE